MDDLERSIDDLRNYFESGHLCKCGHVLGQHYDPDLGNAIKAQECVFCDCFFYIKMTNFEYIDFLMRWRLRYGQKNKPPA